MAAGEFGAEVRQHDGAVVIDLRGDIDVAAEGRLETAYEEAVRDDLKTVLLNFADVDYINSTGIALIVGLLARARKERRAIRAFGLSDHYREIFAITRLSDFMGIHPNEDSAVHAAEAGA